MGVKPGENVFVGVARLYPGVTRKKAEKACGRALKPQGILATMRGKKATPEEEELERTGGDPNSVVISKFVGTNYIGPDLMMKH